MELIFVINLVIFFSVFFVVLFYFVNFLISRKVTNSNKVSAFECGFATVGKVQNSFRIHFFIIMLMFVLFDLEVVMFIGILVSDVNSLFTFLLLILFIGVGFYIE